MPTATQARRALHAHADPVRARGSQRFFKTGPGEYAAGDRFIGVRVPLTRQVARTFAGLPLRAVATLLRSRYHEDRLLALFILVRQFQRGTPAGRGAVFRVYMRGLASINNWDLVDASAPYIVGPYLASSVGTKRAVLWRLARSTRLWDRRIAVLATFHFVRHGRFEDTFRLCERLLGDDEDLIHKACGWMLREIGRRDRPALERFLNDHATAMPRTMLRYAIEHFPAVDRRRYMTRGTNQQARRRGRRGPTDAR